MVFLVFCLLPASASAQSEINGVVTDVSGGVLPGVTVEASSPALIEKVRSAVTDENGRYAIVGLRPGTYRVTFSLAGFSPFVRDGMISPGVRFEYLNSAIDAGSAPAGRFVPARTLPAQSDLPNWFDVAPRFGVVYDLTGDARTALKGTINKYNRNFTVDLARLYDPLFLQQDTRNWSDCDYAPGTSRCSGLALPTNGDDIAQDNEIGPTGNIRFGSAPARHFDPDSKRPYDIEYTLGVEREVMSGVSVAGTWFRRESYNMQQTINRLVSISDYSSFDVTNPLTGEPLTIYNLNPVLTENQNYGSSLGRPLKVLQGRLMRRTAQITF